MQTTVDTTALKVNQASIITLSVLAFVLGTTHGGTWLILAVAAVMAVGTARPSANLFRIFYRRVLMPLHIAEPQVINDDPRPHRFAQGVGATCLLISGFLLLAGATTAGWAFAWLVVALATINLAFGFCAGCFVYYQLQRRGIVLR